MKHGKKYRAALEKIGDPNVEHGLEDAITIVAGATTTKFDPTVEIHITTGCDPKQADEVVRTTLMLPNGTGKSPKVAVFAEEAKQKEAKSAGADIVGGEELIETVGKGKIDFELAVCTPDMMKHLAKAAKVLGPKGLMPSPKNGTVTDDVKKAVEQIKKGRVELKMDSEGNIHSILGKVSFGTKKLLENARALLKTAKENKPSGVKGKYINTLHLSTSMGPGIKVEVQSAMSE